MNGLSRMLSRTALRAASSMELRRPIGQRSISQIRLYSTDKKDISPLARDLADAMAKQDAVMNDGPKENSEGAQEQTEEERLRGKPEWADTAKRSDYQGERDAARTKKLLYSFGAAFVASGLAALYMARNWDDDEWLEHRDIENGYSPGLMYARFKTRFNGVSEYYTAPSIKPELPAHIPKDRPVLIVTVEDVLVHTEWTRKDGWKTYKRPGMDYFLLYLAQYYDIVAWSNETIGLSEPMLAKLDPYHVWLLHAFFKESTTYINGQCVKDISDLNRDLSRVVVLDSDPAALSKQPDNGIIIPKWNGDKDDKELVKLIPLLEYLAHYDKDYRPVLKSFQGSDNYAEEYLRRETELRKRAIENWKKTNAKPSPFLAFLSNLFGFQLPASKPLILQDLYREEGLKNYERIKQYIDQNGEKILQEDKAREKMILEQQKNLTMGDAVKSIVDPAAAAAAAAQLQAEAAKS